MIYYYLGRISGWCIAAELVLKEMGNKSVSGHKVK